MTQADLATKLRELGFRPPGTRTEVNKQTVYRFEHDDNLVTAPLLRLLTFIFDKNAIDFIGE